MGKASIQQNSHTMQMKKQTTKTIKIKPDSIRIFLLEDMITDVELITRELQNEFGTIELKHVVAKNDFIKEIKEFSPDIILSDYNVPGFSGMEALEISLQKCPLIPFVFVSGTLGEETAIETLKQGATDYVLKNNLNRLCFVVSRALKDAAEYKLRIKAEQSLQKSFVELRQRQEELTISEELYRTVVQSANDAIVLINDNGKIVSWNSSAENIYGYREDEIIGLHITVLVPQEYRQKIDCYINESIVSNGHYYKGKIFQGKGLKKNGKIFEIEESFSPTKTKKGRMCITIIRDVSERKLLEGQLQQAQKMESIGTLAGGIAHDFNNILSAIIGYTEITLNDFSDIMQTQANLKAVLDAGMRARDLVSQILMFSRQTELAQFPISVGVILKEALIMIHATLPSTIEIKSNIESSVCVMSNPSKLSQVMMNLFTNAAYAIGEEPGVLEIALNELHINEESLLKYDLIEIGNYVEIKIQDTGCGMTPDVKNRIFDPYFTTKGLKQGTGLGLSVSNGIIKNFKGSILVDSTPGEGTTFWIYLPIVQKSAVHKKGELNFVPRGDERILFIDDEDTLATLGKILLEGLGYHVVTRTSSVEALELFKMQHDAFDLVITDLTMPNIPGDILARKFLQIRPDIPIIVCTGFSNRLSEEKALEIGIKAFIMKPVIKEQIAVTIREVLDTGGGREN